MNHDWQTYIALGIVAAAAVWMLRHLLATGGGSGCGPCGGCNSTTDKEDKSNRIYQLTESKR